MEPQNYPVSVNVKRQSKRGERDLSAQNEWLPLEKVRIIKITPPRPGAPT